MKKWLVYLLGIITGFILTIVFALCINRYNNNGLEFFEEPGECMDFSKFRVIQVVSGCALAEADYYSTIVLIIPEENQEFYDDQKIVLENNQCVQHVGTYKYTTKNGTAKTVPAVRIIDGVEQTDSTNDAVDKRNTEKILFDKPGDCVSRKSFEVQEVLDSGDAIALEIRDIHSGYVFTSDLKVLILAQEGSNFYNKQIVKAPNGKCARQIGNYKYKKYAFGETTVIPIIAFK